MLAKSGPLPRIGPFVRHRWPRALAMGAAADIFLRSSASAAL